MLDRLLVERNPGAFAACSREEGYPTAAVRWKYKLDELSVANQ